LGDSLEEIVTCYKRDSSPQEIMDTLGEIRRFEIEYVNNLDEEFYKAYGYDFNPELWGYTTASFLEELKRPLMG
jgi:hypothetical protein